MKQIEFKTSKEEFLVIEFPQGLVPRRGDVIERTWVLPRLPEGKWLLICRADEIDEEQAKEVVDSDDDYGVVMFRNYRTTATAYYDEQITAIESLNSLLEANGVVFENTPCNNCQNGCPVCCGYGHLCDGCNKQQTYLFKKI